MPLAGGSSSEMEENWLASAPIIVKMSVLVVVVLSGVSRLHLPPLGLDMMMGHTHALWIGDIILHTLIIVINGGGCLGGRSIILEVRCIIGL